NQEEEVEKAQYLFEGYDMEDTHHVTKESLADKLVKVHQQMIQQPIHLVEVDDFKLLLKGFDSHFKMPYLFELHKIVLEIGELDNHCTIDIVESVNSVLDKFNINHQKIFSITTDNEANVKSAIQQMGITNIKCAEHKLQLNINLGLKQVDELISKPAIMQLYLTFNNHTLREVRKKAETMKFLSESKYPMLGFMTPMLEELAYQLGQNDEIFVKDTILNNLIE
ncbi:11448_t:CDS:2, partial [Gigaspora margarita]